ncbi:MAG: lipopolysaccharide kinase InaA family protein [Candidatus Aminicenantales bacterium]
MFESRSLDPPSYRGFVAYSDEGPALAALKNFPGLMASPSAETLHDGRNKIVAVRLPGGREAVIKIFGVRGLQKLKTLVVPSKGFRAWSGAAALSENGFGTASPIAVFERRRHGLAVESVFIAGRVRGGREIREWFRESPESALRELLAALAPVLARMHQAGIVHRDLSDGNILVLEKNPAQYDFLFLDTNRVRRRRSVGPFGRARNLVRLGLPPALRPFFLDEYAASAGPSVSRKRLGFYYRAAKRSFVFWLALKKSLRLRKAARKLGLQ